MSEYCVLFMNHTSNTEKYDIIKSKCDEEDVDCINLNPDWAHLKEKYKDYWFTPNTDLIDSDNPYFTVENNGYVGNCFLPVWDFKETHPEYKYFMFIEYDVNFTGDWGFIIHKFKILIPDHIDCLMQDRPLSKIEDPNWFWWEHGSYETDDWISSHLLCNIYIMSDEMIDAVIGTYKKGMKGHHETIIGTTLRMLPKLYRQMLWPNFCKCYLDYTQSKWENNLRDGIIRENCLYHPDNDCK